MNSVKPPSCLVDKWQLDPEDQMGYLAVSSGEDKLVNKDMITILLSVHFFFTAYSS